MMTRSRDEMNPSKQEKYSSGQAISPTTGRWSAPGFQLLTKSGHPSPATAVVATQRLATAETMGGCAQPALATIGFAPWMSHSFLGRQRLVRSSGVPQHLRHHEHVPQRDRGALPTTAGAEEFSAGPTAQLIKLSRNKRATKPRQDISLTYVSTRCCTTDDMMCFVHALLASELLNPANTITIFGGMAHRTQPCLHPKEVSNSRNADASAGAW